MNGAGLRVLADVAPADGGWSVRLTSPADPTWSWPPAGEPPRLMRTGTHGGRRVPLPDPGWCLGGPSHDLCCAATGATVSGAIGAVASRASKIARDGGASLGQLLFAALLGPDSAGWQAVDELARRHAAEGGHAGGGGAGESGHAGGHAGEGGAVELALRWRPDDADLSRLPWELMHDGRRFLATSFGDVPVAVTRVLAGTRGVCDPLQVPPRVLFVVGTDVTDQRVRPGAEVLGLLRAIRGSGLRIHQRVLHNASPDRLHAAVETFRPNVIHVIAHGGSGPGGAYVELAANDRDNRTPERRYAPAFAEQITVRGRKPPIVVLSACETGALHLPGPAVVAPFAVQLVAAGIPVVAAMAGMVTDRACRLFTRRFGEAVAAGRSITAATAEARRMAFAGETGNALDWALPAVFLSDDDAPLAMVCDHGRAVQVSDWVARFRVDNDPVFCGREAILSAFLSLLSRPDGGRTGWETWQGDARRSVLAVCVDQGAAGVGKKRLLAEMARQALLDGHLPVLVGTANDMPAPESLAQLCRLVAQGVVNARVALGLPADQQTQTELLYSGLESDDAGLPGAHATVARYHGLGMAERAVAWAIRLDLTELIREARQRFDHFRAGPGHAVLLLNRLGRASTSVLSALLDIMLDEFGIGAPDEPIPVVLVVLVGAEQDLRHDLRAHGSGGRPWLQVEKLGPFDHRTGEDLFAYEQVMLHPFLGNQVAGITDLAWAFNRELDDDQRAQLAEDWHSAMAGLPIRFVEGGAFPMAIRFSRTGKLVVAANDEDRVRADG